MRSTKPPRSRSAREKRFEMLRCIAVWKGIPLEPAKRDSLEKRKTGKRREDLSP